MTSGKWAVLLLFDSTVDRLTGCVCTYVCMPCWMSLFLRVDHQAMDTKKRDSPCGLRLSPLCSPHFKNRSDRNYTSGLRAASLLTHAWRGQAPMATNGHQMATYLSFFPRPSRYIGHRPQGLPHTSFSGELTSYSMGTCDSHMFCGWRYSNIQAATDKEGVDCLELRGIK